VVFCFFLEKTRDEPMSTLIAGTMFGMSGGSVVASGSPTPVQWVPLTGGGQGGMWRDTRVPGRGARGGGTRRHVSRTLRHRPRPSGVGRARGGAWGESVAAGGRAQGGAGGGLRVGASDHPAAAAGVCVCICALLLMRRWVCALRPGTLAHFAELHDGSRLQSLCKVGITGSGTDADGNVPNWDAGTWLPWDEVASENCEFPFVPRASPAPCAAPRILPDPARAALASQAARWPMPSLKASLHNARWVLHIPFPRHALPHGASSTEWARTRRTARCRGDAMCCVRGFVFARRHALKCFLLRCVEGPPRPHLVDCDQGQVEWTKRSWTTPVQDGRCVIIWPLDKGDVQQRVQHSGWRAGFVIPKMKMFVCDKLAGDPRLFSSGNEQIDHVANRPFRDSASQSKHTQEVTCATVSLRISTTPLVSWGAEHHSTTL